MCDFKQIIGRGTRVRDDYGKLWFNIVDYTGSATRMFADSDFDGDPARITEEDLNTDRQATEIRENGSSEIQPRGSRSPASSSPRQRNRANSTSTAARWKLPPTWCMSSMSTAGNLGWCAIRTTLRKGRVLLPLAPELRAKWADPEQRVGDHPLPGRTRHRFRRTGRYSRPARGRPVRPALPLGLQRAPAHPPRARTAPQEKRKDFFERYGPEARVSPGRASRKIRRTRRRPVRAARRAAKFPPISSHGQIGDIVASSAEPINSAPPSRTAESLYAA